MANNFDSNTTRKLARVFLDKFESERVVSKTVNTQLLNGRFNPSSGTTVDFKRPTDYASKRTTGGDISGGNRSDIITGKATGTVQDYFTVDVDWNIVDEALKMDQLDELLAPMATRIKTDLELDFQNFALKNCNLSYGAPGTAVDAWGDVAGAGALMSSAGIPMDEKWNYIVNPFTQTSLSEVQRSIGAADSLVSPAFQNATIADNFAGMRVMSSSAMKSFTSGDSADRVGAVASNPDVTYATHKDTMIQDIAVSGLTANGTIKAGEVVEVAGRYRLNMSTREMMLDASGAGVLWRGVVNADVTLSGTGTGTIAVSGPAIYEANGAYNTTDSAVVSGDVITIKNAASTVYQPNLFYHKNAFAIGSVPIPKLYSTDTIATTEDGLQFRISKYADGDANKQILRIDFQPAYAALNPFFAGQGFGV